jgi:ATP-dependent helicase HrpA
LSFEQLVQPGAHVAGPEDFPDTWRQGDADLGLTYVFDPGAPDDGVHVEIPLVILNQLDEAGFDWQVPGHRQELVTALIRSLPRPLRRQFVPAIAFARAFLAEKGPRDGPLLLCLEQHLGVPPGSVEIETIPPHLRLTFRIVAGDGATVDQGHDLRALRRRLQDLTRSEIARATESITRTGQQTWTFGTIPRQVDTTWAGLVIRAYPALVDEGSTVGLSAWGTEAEQRREMWAGTSRLLSLLIRLPTKQLERRLRDEAKLALGRTAYGTLTNLIDDCATAAFDRALDLHGGPVWDEAAFAALEDGVGREVTQTAEAVVTFAGGILTATARLRDRLDRLSAPKLQPAAEDMREQLAGLVRPRFVQTTGAARLPDLLRYVRAIGRRLDKLPENSARDSEHMVRIQQLADHYRTVVAASNVPPAAREEVRWMLEELRVSAFAQVLGTPKPVSEQRVRRAIDRLAG